MEDKKGMRKDKICPYCSREHNFLANLEFAKACRHCGYLEYEDSDWKDYWFWRLFRLIMWERGFNK